MNQSLGHFFLVFWCFFVSFNSNTVSSLNSEGLALLSILRYWSSEPNSIISSWNSSNPNPCSWLGVECDNITHSVVSLNLSGSAISGNLGPEIGQLKQLRSIDLNTNTFSGDIPWHLGKCTLLEYLDLSNNIFSGEIPDSFKSLRNLESLVLSTNSLSGKVPESLTNLENLVELHLNENKLKGGIPSGFGKCKNLESLDFSTNTLTGGLPPDLGNCSRLVTIEISNNNLGGSIPSSFGQLKKLSILDLSENRLSGWIPPELGHCKSLRTLNLDTNELEGKIPSELGRLPKLEHLLLLNNHLSGEIPVSIWRIPSLQSLNVYNNSLSGVLPIEMTHLKNLKRVTLYDNQFFGAIPQSLGINSSLMQLDFTNNKFTGEIPPNLCLGKQLKFLSLGRNQLQGSIPSDLAGCSTLWRLTLEENKLSGVFPEFAENHLLSYMDISRNRIKGPIPHSIGNYSRLSFIDLSMNELTGSIPPEIGDLRELVKVNLSSNHLEGSLPSQLSECYKLQNFDVGFNSLNGMIPLSFRNWTSLTTLSLRENYFTGGIPLFISELEKLSELQLGGNLLGGEIPSSIGSLQGLKYALNISNNGLVGKIPSELGNFIMLEQLDISHNNLTGTLAILEKIHSLLQVNVSYNNFSGPIPKRLMPSSSFWGNPNLCVSCLPADGLQCTNNSSFKPCDMTSSSQEGLSKVAVTLITVAAVVTVVILVGLVYMFVWRRRFKQNRGMVHDVEIAAQEGPSSLLNEVMQATENLNDRHIIGRGAHGTVYKASLLGGEKIYAVKKIVFTGHDGGKKSMVAEIKTAGKVRHRNLLKLENVLSQKDYGLILYAYMENGSLRDVLYGSIPPQTLEWSIRYKIAVGTAHGLAYLHYDCVPPIVHRDIKPQNILLDSDMEPHISDFGLAKLLDLSSASSQSSMVAGTFGYIAPENAFSTIKSKESDVYSYGVVLLELLTRKKTSDPLFADETDIAGWVRSVWSSTKDISSIVDSGLREELLALNIMNKASDVFLVALRCTEQDPSGRPSMRDVVMQLLKTNDNIRVRGNRN